MQTGIILTPWYFPTLCGMTYASDAHARILKNLGIDTHIITSKSDNSQANFINQNGINIHRISIQGSGLPWSKVQDKQEELTHKILGISPDFIISEGWHTWGTHWFHKEKIKNCKYIISSHGSSQGKITPNLISLIKWAGYRCYDIITENKIFHNLDAGILLSDYQDNERFRDYIRLKKYRIPTYTSPNTSIFNKEKNEKKSPPYKIIHIGDMSKNKNQNKALEIYKKVINEVPATLDFIYPSDNEYSKKLKRRIKENKLSNKVNLIKGLNREELKNIIKSSSLILVTSITEAQPISVIDAQAFGIPFVSSPVGCLPNMQGGICERYNNMHHHIINILKSDQIYQDLSKSAFNNHAQYHTMNQATEKFKLILTELNIL